LPVKLRAALAGWHAGDVCDVCVYASHGPRSNAAPQWPVTMATPLPHQPIRVLQNNHAAVRVAIIIIII